MMIKKKIIVFSLLISYFFNSFIFCDAAHAWQLGLQAPATPIAEGIINFHNHIMFYIVGIAIFVSWLLTRCLVLFSASENKEPVDNFTHATLIEIVWTVVPAIILVFIAIPSFSLLYSMDEVVDPILTLKVIGHQWYWSYEYSDYNHMSDDNSSINFDSYMIADDDLALGTFRLLEVDNRVVLPSKSHIRVLITAADVLHSWAVPSFGIKVDGCPGRLNQVTMFINRTGVFYGQCSELCGTNHGFMPIAVEVLKLPCYLKWVEFQLANKD